MMNGAAHRTTSPRSSSALRPRTTLARSMSKAKRSFFKIDYYDPSMDGGSEDARPRSDRPRADHDARERILAPHPPSTVSFLSDPLPETP